MRLRLKLLRIILHNCKHLVSISVIIAHRLLPDVSAIRYFYVGSSEAQGQLQCKGLISAIAILSGRRAFS